MTDKDYILRAIAGNGLIRAFCATARNMAEAGRLYHNTSPVITAVLGRLLTGASMMGLMLGNDENLLTLRVNGQGDASGLLVTANGKGNVKGYPYNPWVDRETRPDGKLDVGGALGQGRLTVIMDLGLEEPYVGTVDLVSGEIAEDLAYYFAVSEQTPSVVALGVLVDVDCSVKQAGGFILQLLPGAPQDLADRLEEKISSLPPVTAMLEEGKTPEDILQALLLDFGWEVVEKTEVAYHCDCSRERVEKALASLGRNELEEMISQDGGAEVKCHFCDKNYWFTEKELSLLTEK